MSLIAAWFASGSHNAEAVAVQLRQVFSQYKLGDQQLHCGVTDGGGNYVNAVQNELKHEHHVCFGHTLNLVVQDCLKQHDPFIDQVRVALTCCVRSIASSWQLSRQIKYARSTDFGKKVRLLFAAYNKKPKRLLQVLALRVQYSDKSLRSAMLLGGTALIRCSSLCCTLGSR